VLKFQNLNVLHLEKGKTRLQGERPNLTKFLITGTRCGPATIADEEWGAKVLSKCRGNSKLYTKPTTMNEPCRGDSGTLITKTSDLGLHTHDFCPAGTAPLAPQGNRSIFHSWHCSDAKISKESQYCCRINGEEHCGTEIVDASKFSNGCQCGVNDKVTMAGKL